MDRVSSLSNESFTLKTSDEVTIDLGYFVIFIIFKLSIKNLVKFNTLKINYYRHKTEH